MTRIKQRVTLPDGIKVWCIGNWIDIHISCMRTWQNSPKSTLIVTHL